MLSSICENIVFTVASNKHKLANTTILRRQNVLDLFQAYAERSMATGASPKGLEQAFAATLQISPSMWSQIKSSRPIGDKLARQIEHLCGKPGGWLDEARAVQAITPVEQAFLALALGAWRATNSAGKKQMRAQLSGILQDVPGVATKAAKCVASPKPTR